MLTSYIGLIIQKSLSRVVELGSIAMITRSGSTSSCPAREIDRGIFHTHQVKSLETQGNSAANGLVYAVRIHEAAVSLVLAPDQALGGSFDAFLHGKSRFAI